MPAEGYVMLGQPPNFWLFSERDGFDLTRPKTHGEPSTQPRLTMQTSKTPVTVAPDKTAVLVVDMQNFFLSPALRPDPSAGRAAEQALLTHGIPAARKAGIRILWLGWGISDHNLPHVPPLFWRNFGFTCPDSEHESSRQQWRQADVGLGAPMGEVTLENGEKVDAGRKLMRDQWNTALHGQLEEAYKHGVKLTPPDEKFHKETLSGFFGANTGLSDFLQAEGITTLLFAGVNTDQCVLTTFDAAANQGYDTILLKDACGTNSPNFARDMVEFNSNKAFGFLSSCEDFYQGAMNM